LVQVKRVLRGRERQGEVLLFLTPTTSRHTKGVRTDSWEEGRDRRHRGGGLSEKKLESKGEPSILWEKNQKDS